MREKETCLEASAKRYSREVWTLSLLLLPFFLLILAACDLPDTVSPDPDQTLARCQNDEDCDEGFVCERRFCVPEEKEYCEHDGDCPDYFICERGECVPEQQETDSCIDDADCDEGYSCGDGQCVRDSDDECIIHEDCGDGFSCADGRCVRDSAGDCALDEDCDDGYVCEGGSCVLESEDECTRNDDCASGYVCEQGQCVLDVLVQCDVDEDCEDNEYCVDTQRGRVCECIDNYSRSGNECLPDQREVVCTNYKPAASIWTSANPNGRIMQTWDGQEFSPSADSCEWECNQGYHEFNQGGVSYCVECVDNSHCSAPTPACDSATRSCVECVTHSDCSPGNICQELGCRLSTRTFVCDPKSPNSEWNTVDSYQQNWNLTTNEWEPENSQTHYNELPDDSSCRFRCPYNHRWNGQDCEQRPVCSSGAHFGAGVTVDNLLNAMGICDYYDAGNPNSFGIVPGSAQIVRANWPADTGAVGQLQYSVMTQFGTHASNLPAFGNNMAVLSSGRARDANDPDRTSHHSYSYDSGSPPADFVSAHGGQLPLTRPGSSCAQGYGANDSVNLRVQLKVPDFANAFSFEFRFFSQEYWQWTCTAYNDFFITMLDTAWTPDPGQSPIPADKNISFDSSGNYISVNSDQFFTVCTPKTGYPCPGGTDPLAGTGYAPLDGGGTEWLTTNAPVVPGETITLRFIIWDTSDQQYDSLVLIDNFRWHAAPGGGPTTTPTCVELEGPCTANDDCCSELCHIPPGDSVGYCIPSMTNI